MKPGILFRYEPGWVGAFTRQEAEGAWPNGTRVVKVITEKGDGHEIGSMATVLGSISHPELPSIFYFLEWDDTPRIVIGCMDAKLARLPDAA